MQIAIIVVLGVLVIAAVAWPLLRGGRGHHSDAQEFAVDSPAPRPGPMPEQGIAPAARRPAEPAKAEAPGLEGEIGRYRAAVAAGTVCIRCGEANPADAKFCRECGKALPASEAQEFAK